MEKTVKAWMFNGTIGDFSMENPELTSYLYFPLANKSGMVSSITPLLGGDCKTDQNTFALTPVSAEDLHNSRATRNFWIYTDRFGGWSAAGVSCNQLSKTFSADKEETALEAGILWHKVTRKNPALGVQSEITSFIPYADTVELTRVVITNTGDEPLVFKPYVAVPLYGRGADNLRDHRHVTSLLHRIRITGHGVQLTPTIAFDEHGHKVNQTCYGVFAAEGDGTPPIACCPITEQFIGEGGSFENPRAVGSELAYHEGDTAEGYEAVGAVQLPDKTLAPGQSAVYVFAVMIAKEQSEIAPMCVKYLSADRFAHYLQETKAFWQQELNLHFYTGDERCNQWLRWVSLEPALRRICGSSFLPHFDYGRGGRGWRDLWQDCLALLLMDTQGVRSILLNSFAGVRFDGTNATIIGAAQGEFIADRNSIARVWMDHAAWPLITTRLYIDQTADIDFLLQTQCYFKDSLVCRATKRDNAWSPEKGSRLIDETGEVYCGTILEHLLIQNLAAFYNVGEHNIIRLEHADWNNGMDMAFERGESAALTYLYYGNLTCLIELLNRLRVRGVRHITVSQQLLILLDELGAAANYDSFAYKRSVLLRFNEASVDALRGGQTRIAVEDVIANLTAKTTWMVTALRRQEYITNRDGYSWYNDYYDNDGAMVDGDNENGTRVMLTGQAFSVLSGVATTEQVRSIIATTDRYLFDEALGGNRLNTNFHELKTNLGRLFAYAYGHKENGAMFSLMDAIYAYALYSRSFVKEGFRMLDTLYRHCCDFESARIYPGVPEYSNPTGQGICHYLTGAASWIVL
ncbi:MAG: GH36-type glycosyl hydrolase domain-containing protein, partial [Acetanaerobacterium sp.]